MNHFTHLICSLLLSASAAGIDKKPMDAASQEPNPAQAAPKHTELLRSFQAILLQGDLAIEELMSALDRKSEFHAWKLRFTELAAEAEVGLAVRQGTIRYRWDWSFVDLKSGDILAKGKVVAFDTRGAAFRVAGEFVKCIRAARPLPLGPAVSPAGSGVRHWDVKYESGNSLDYRNRGKSFTLGLSSQGLTAAGPAGAAISLPLDHILTILPLKENRDTLRDWKNYPVEDMLTATVILVGIAVMKISRYQPTTIHFIRIEWEDDGMLKYAIFRVSPTAYQEVTDELRKFGDRNS